jgi:hypothetical protein
MKHQQLAFRWSAPPKQEGRKQPLFIRGVKYESMAAAARALGVSKNAVAYAKRTDQLETLGIGPKGNRIPIVIGHRQFESINQAARILGVGSKRLARASLDGRLEDFAGIEPPPPFYTKHKPTVYNGVEYPSMAAAAKAAGCQPKTLYRRMERARLSIALGHGGIFMCSHKKYAKRWREFRDKHGYRIRTEWLDGSEESPRKSRVGYETMVKRRFKQIAKSKAFIFYGRVSEVTVMVGVQLGIAIANNVPIFVVSPDRLFFDDFSGVTRCDTVIQALNAAQKLVKD